MSANTNARGIRPFRSVGGQTRRRSRPDALDQLVERVRPGADQVHGVLVRVLRQRPAPLPVPAQLGHQVGRVLGTAVGLQQQYRHPGRRRPHRQAGPLHVAVAEPVTGLALEAEQVPDPGPVEFGGRRGGRCGMVTVASTPPSTPAGSVNWCFPCCG
ncbi:hypothetical protein ACF1DY_10620 [Streptomyces albus]